MLQWTMQEDDQENIAAIIELPIEISYQSNVNTCIAVYKGNMQ